MAPRRHCRSEQSVAIVLGAGWSAAVGLPLAAQLFDRPALVVSEGSAQRMHRTLGAYESWAAEHPERHPEQFLSDVRTGSVALGPMPNGQLDLSGCASALPWQWAVELVGVKLAGGTLLDPRRWSSKVVIARKEWELRGRYSNSFRVMPELVHARFWDRIPASATITGVITTNYDLMIERSLWAAPQRGFHYGGLPMPQAAWGGEVDWSVRFTHPRPTVSRENGRWIPLTGKLPIYKLHGSLNWALDGGGFELYEDARPAFRKGGTSAIVPPLPEKEAPPWLSSVWEEARDALASTATWIVIGYSLPSYDHALAELFGAAAREAGAPRIDVHDPMAERVAKRWREISPHSQIVEHPGLGEEPRSVTA